MTFSFPVTINIQTMTNCCGVFISEQNITYGWGSHSKTNTGSGSYGSANVVYNNVAIVYDPDFIDTPIDDRDTNILTQYNTRNQPQPTCIGFESINVNSLNHNSGLFVGETNLTGMDAHEKENKGIGSLYGNSTVTVGNTNAVFDNDLLDTPINDQDMKAGVFNG